jgi:hypothetical protein
MADSPLYLSTHDQAPSSAGSSPGSGGAGIGDLRRRYNFGGAVSELAIDQTPFFRFLNSVSRKPTDDPEFKSLEQRSMWQKRYAYVLGYKAAWDGSAALNTLTFVTNAPDIGTGAIAADSYLAVSMGADYKSAGTIQNISGQTGVAAGSAGTKPIFFLKDQLVKIPVSSADGADYIVGRIILDPVDDSNQVELGLKIVRGVPAPSSGNYSFANDSGSAFKSAAADLKEAYKCYVVGSAFAEGSSFPSTFKDTPYTDVWGYTQIFKTSMQMTNTARATALKIVPDEWARVWKNKLIEHKWDIEQALLFGKKHADGTTRYTQGAIDYITSNGNLFEIDLATDGSGTSSDDFLENMSTWMDPRYNNANATLFMCSTAVYNWFHKLAGYVKSNVQLGGQYRLDFNITGRSVKFGLDMTKISTPYGDMNLVRNVHLDSGNKAAGIVAVNMKHVKYRPLVGNGVNRDTAIYVGVQSLENTGVDRRIDLIQTEAGLDIVMPEAHAVWKDVT